MSEFVPSSSEPARPSLLERFHHARQMAKALRGLGRVCFSDDIHERMRKFNSPRPDGDIISATQAPLDPALARRWQEQGGPTTLAEVQLRELRDAQELRALGEVSTEPEAHSLDPEILRRLMGQADRPPIPE